MPGTGSDIKRCVSFINYNKTMHNTKIEKKSSLNTFEIRLGSPRDISSSVLSSRLYICVLIIQKKIFCDPMTSFKKAGRSKVVHPRGTKPSLHNSQLLISSGTPSLDALLGNRCCNIIRVHHDKDVLF